MIRHALKRLIGSSDATPAELSFDDAKQQVRSHDPETRRAVALDPNTKPELLYFLARDVSADVRAAVAAHASTPRQADLLLAVDDVAEVRTLVAEKVTSQIQSMPQDDAAQVWQLTVSILEALARDDLTRVRQLVAETARGLEKIPKTIAITLARDRESSVALPALEYPGRFSDEELIEIVRGAHDPRIVAAVARRPSIGAAVAQAVVERGDEAPIAALLANRTVTLDPRTMEMVIERAPEMASWHEPLAMRPELNDSGAEQLSGTLSTSLRERPSAGRRAGDTPTLGARLQKRVAQSKAPPLPEVVAEVIEPDDDLPERISRLDARNALTEDFVIDALIEEPRLAVAVLALKARIEAPVVEKIFRSYSAKGLVSLAWRAGYTMRLALQLQTRVGRLPPKARLTGSAGAWPLPTDEMTWQIEFFRTLVPNS